MTAYELATGLENHFKGNFITSESALLLRQQADRIAELEKLLEHSVGSDCREMRYIQEIENKDARIAELEKQTKPLSDEEIWNWFNENTALTKESALRIARAIEERHGIK